MPTYQMPIPTRQEWQQLRDQNKVPKGAAKVSIGDSIDSVRNSLALASISKNRTATEKLIKDLDAYLVVIKKKYPAFEQPLTKQVKNKAVAHKRFVDDQIKAKTEYYPRYAATMTAYNQLTIHGKGKAKDVAKGMERLLGCVAAFALLDPTWEAKRKELNRMMSEFERADTLTDGHKDAFEKIMKSLEPKK